MLPGGLAVFAGRGWTRVLESVRVSRLYSRAVGRHGSVGGGAEVFVGVGHGVRGQGRVLDVLGDVGSDVGVQVSFICNELL